MDSGQYSTSRDLCPENTGYSILYIRKYSFEQKRKLNSPNVTSVLETTDGSYAGDMIRDPDENSFRIALSRAKPERKRRPCQTDGWMDGSDSRTLGVY
jgi:hypothetical protein